MLPKMWSDLIRLDRQVDALIGVVDKVVHQTKPISREIPVFASAELLFSSLPPRFSSTVLPASNITSGQNMKRAVFENGGSRLYIREINFVLSAMSEASGAPARLFANGNIPPFIRWNFETSITNRRYAPRPVVLDAAGRYDSGSRIAFRDPLVLEPREALNIDVELLCFGMSSTQTVTQTNLVVSPGISGYREGM